MTWEQFTLPLWLRHTQPDLLHLPWYEGPLRPGVPFVLTVHDLDTVLHPHRYSLQFRAYYNELLLRYAGDAAHIICPSRYTAATVASHLGRTDSTVIYQGVDEVFFTTPKEACQTVLVDAGIDPGKPLMLLPGGTGPRKNLKIVAGLLQQLDRAGVDGSLIVTGVNTAPEPLASTKLRRIKVHALGRLPTSTLAGLYANASVTLVPSEFEGFSFPLVEAMAAGSPIVASDASCHREIAEGIASFCPTHDVDAFTEATLAILRESPELDPSDGKLRAMQFNWASTAQRTLCVYRKLLGSPPGSCST
jgi:glycosyltransferase involved in cell wall biosynthesis